MGDKENGNKCIMSDAQFFASAGAWKMTKMYEEIGTRDGVAVNPEDIGVFDLVMVHWIGFLTWFVDLDGDLAGYASHHIGEHADELPLMVF